MQFSGGAPALTALLGGHTDAMFDPVGLLVPQVRSNAVRVLGVLDKKESGFLPAVKTAEAQGFKVYLATNRSLGAPGGTPKEIVELLAGTIKKVLNDDELKKKYEEAGQAVGFVGPEETLASWAELETQYLSLMDLAKE